MTFKIHQQASNDVSKEQLQWIDFYKIYLERVKNKPSSVYRLCKFSNRAKADFYTAFSSLDDLEKKWGKLLFQSAANRVLSSPEFTAYSARERTLFFYFTLFDLLNKEYKYPCKSYVFLWESIAWNAFYQGFKSAFKVFAQTMLLQEAIENGEIKTRALNSTPIQYLFEKQCDYLFHFWCKDASENKEKTDIAIEKSTHLLFNLLQNNWVDDVADFSIFNWRQFF